MADFVRVRNVKSYKIRREPVNTDFKVLKYCDKNSNALLLLLSACFPSSNSSLLFCSSLEEESSASYFILDARHTLILGSQLTLKNTQILDVPQPRNMRQTSRQISGDINLIHVMRLEVHSTTPPTPSAMGQSFIIINNSVL
jgi:hypothetical protein